MSCILLEIVSYVDNLTVSKKGIPILEIEVFNLLFTPKKYRSYRYDLFSFFFSLKSIFLADLVFADGASQLSLCVLFHVVLINFRFSVSRATCLRKEKININQKKKRCTRCPFIFDSQIHK